MAPNRSFRDDPPSASSSSETEAEEEVVPHEEEEEPQEEEEEEPVEEEEAEQEKSQPQSSDSETESEPDRDPINRAVSAPAPKKRGSEPNGEASKRLKTESASESEKKQQRLWSESDEMVVLEGLIEFNDLKKDKPYFDFNDFYEIIRKRMRSFVSKRQMSSKIQNFKKRFRSCERRAAEGARLKPQDQAFLEMSRKIWGSSADNNTAAAPAEKEPAASTPVVVESKEGCCSVSGSHWFVKEIVRLSGGGMVSEEMVREGMDLVDESKRAEMDRRWRKLQEKELDIVLERSWLIQEQTALIVKAYKSLGS